MLAVAWYDYVPLATAALAAVFAVTLYRHWRTRRDARHLLWWTIGVVFFGLAVLMEAVVTLWEWHPWLFRTWYISGALLGGAPLAQGTVYLLLKRRTANGLAVGMVAYAAVAAALVLLTPLTLDAADPEALTGRIMDWGWIRAFTPLLNLYAVVFLVGGAAWSAARYFKLGEAWRARAIGNTFIAVGAVLPALRGMVARLGLADVMFLTELVGLGLIFAGYRVIAQRRSA